MKNQRYGFTLMEMLVVVVIIGILSALLFPVFGRMQERGREVKCASNLRQLHQAAMSFTANNGGRLPHSASAQIWDRDASGEYRAVGWARGWVASHPVDTVGMQSYWWEAGGSNGTYCIQNGSLFQYLGDAGDEAVYVCPTMLVKARDVMSVAYRQVTRSYGMNLDVSDALYQDIDGLSRKIMFADQGFDRVGRNQCLRTALSGPNDTQPTSGAGRYYRRFNRGMDGSIDYRAHQSSQPEFIGELHGRKPGQNTGMANVIFCDGHVERVTHTETDYVCRGDWEYGKRVP